jgi:hypothetical protein
MQAFCVERHGVFFYLIGVEAIPSQASERFRGGPSKAAAGEKAHP